MLNDELLAAKTAEDDGLYNVLTDFKKYNFIKLKFLAIALFCLFFISNALFFADILLEKYNVSVVIFICTLTLVAASFLSVTCLDRAINEKISLNDESLSVLGDLIEHFNITELSEKLQEEGELTLGEARSFVKKSN